MIVSRKTAYDNTKIRLRGQDYTNVYDHGPYRFIHNLLAITGDFTIQPFVDGDIVCVFNGEIYNQPYKRSDGEVLIPMYREYGPRFVEKLDGEFAIALYDMEKDIVIHATDPFGTKPLWVKEDECASYESGIGGTQVPPNTLLINGKAQPIHTWDFDNQTKDTYDDWIQAFKISLRKRASGLEKGRCFIGLSSGYDSGALACMLNHLDDNQLRYLVNIEYKAYSIPAEENQNILKKRQRKTKNKETVVPTKKEYDSMQVFLKNWAEDYRYWNGSLMTDDKGAVGLGLICDRARKENRDIYLSGQGADEIMSDYMKFPGQGELKKFPKKLKKWQNFDDKCQRSYIAKEEQVAGAFNIETRYPFLDKQVVQEFLWLTPELKNRYYKAPLHEYMTRENYPFDEDVKVGFRADKNLR